MAVEVFSVHTCEQRAELSVTLTGVYNRHVTLNASGTPLLALRQTPGPMLPGVGKQLVV